MGIKGLNNCSDKYAFIICEKKNNYFAFINYKCSESPYDSVQTGKMNSNHKHVFVS